MTRKKTIQSVEETKKPQALIINGAEVSDFLAETLKERGCEVKKIETYSPIKGFADYVFLFDNENVADEIYEKNLATGGKFILVLTKDSSFPFRNKFKILKVGDPLFWSMPDLSEKILSALFSGNAPAVIDFGRKPKVPKIPQKVIPPEKEIITKPEKINVKPIEEMITPTAVLVEKTQRFSFKNFLAIIFIFIIFSLIVLVSTAYWYLKNLEKTFANLNYHLKSSNVAALTGDFKEIKSQITTGQNIYNLTTGIFPPLKEISYIQQLGTLIDEGNKLIDSSEDFVLAVSDILPTKSGFNTSTGNISPEKLTGIEKKSANFAATLITSQEKIDKITLPFFPKENIKATLSPLIPKLISAYEMLPVLAQVFYTSSPKVYLVLLQNNMELRPTGGFIGSYGLLTLSQGKILDFKLEDVYTADGQLKGHVDPPVPIRKYLSQPNFFLRDSNFDPDFAASAVQASFFLQKELGKNVDGVIGVNLTLAQKLMQVVGPIKLSDFGGEEITSDNFFYKVHYLSTANFFPGSTAKKDVLTAITNEIFSKTTSGVDTNLLELVPIVRQALEEKNIMIYVDDESLQKIIEEHGWAGRMVNIQCTQKKNETGEQIIPKPEFCLPDYFSVIEANLGVNKANYFINKSTVLEKKISSDGAVSTTVTISYENSNNTLVLTPQTYVNYLRIYTPLGSKLTSATLNNAPLSLPDLDSQSYGGDKNVFGLLVKIAPDNKGVVKITYLLPRSFTGDISDYQLFYQKQPGDKNSPFIFSLTASSGFKLKPVNFSSTAQKENEIFYTTDTSVDRIFALRRE